VFIPRGFKFNEIASAHSKGLRRPFFVSAYSKAVTVVDERQSTSAPPNVPEALIPGEFKSNKVVKGHSNEPTKLLFVRVHSKEVMGLGGHSW